MGPHIKWETTLPYISITDMFRHSILRKKDCVFSSTTYFTYGSVFMYFMPDKFDTSVTQSTHPLVCFQNVWWAKLLSMNKQILNLVLSFGCLTPSVMWQVLQSQSSVHLLGSNKYMTGFNVSKALRRSCFFPSRPEMFFRTIRICRRSLLYFPHLIVYHDTFPFWKCVIFLA